MTGPTVATSTFFVGKQFDQLGEHRTGRSVRGPIGGVGTDGAAPAEIGMEGGCGFGHLGMIMGPTAPTGWSGAVAAEVRTVAPAGS